MVPAEIIDREIALLIKHRLLTGLFSLTLFLSATLLFSAQPMIAKMLLPSLGGTPAVWNTCMVFFQAILLVGYAYGHLVASRPNKLIQFPIHFGLIFLATVFLPLGLGNYLSVSFVSNSKTILAVLGILTMSIGLPMFIVSTSAPILQKWFSRTSHPSATDPYFLYSASNAGSLTALVAYPTLIEPNFVLQQQSRIWSLGYLLLSFLIILCAAIRWQPHLLKHGAKSRRVSDGETPRLQSPRENPLPGLRARIRWTALAFAPSSWMLALTTYITTDIASVPLFWVIPLALYLLTFILAFAKNSFIPVETCERALPIGALAVIYLLLSQATQPVWLLMSIHMSVFFIAGLACHGRLAAERPSREHLTEFYFWISLGGVLGGLFNALVAPLFFTRILEYPITIIAACCLRTRPTLKNATSSNPTPMIEPIAIGKSPSTPPQDLSACNEESQCPSVESEISKPMWTLLKRKPAFGIAVAFIPGLVSIIGATVLVPNLGLPFQISMAIVFGTPLILGFLMVDVPIRFGLALAGVVVGSLFAPDGHGRTLHSERNFFGVLRITQDPIGPFRRLVHGSTLHGRQFINPARHCEPLSYYHRSGPLQNIFKVAVRTSGCTNVAVIGLGAGSAACYSTPNQQWTFYEINPAVVAIARNTNYFSNLSTCMTAESKVVLGDARLRLHDAQPHPYELMILDAFSSDSIPVHLLTREAIDLYISKLAHNGILAFHISNRSLDLKPVLGDLASHLGLVCFSFNQTELFPFEIAQGKDASHWMVMAQKKEDLGNIPRYDLWLPVRARSNPEVWTDEFSNILRALNWR